MILIFIFNQSWHISLGIESHRTFEIYVAITINVIQEYLKYDYYQMFM